MSAPVPFPDYGGQDFDTAFRALQREMSDARWRLGALLDQDTDERERSAPAAARASQTSFPPPLVTSGWPPPPGRTAWSAATPPAEHLAPPSRIAPPVRDPGFGTEALTPQAAWPPPPVVVGSGPAAVGLGVGINGRDTVGALRTSASGFEAPIAPALTPPAPTSVERLAPPLTTAEEAPSTGSSLAVLDRRSAEEKVGAATEKRARPEWIANVATVLLAGGVLLVVLALISIL